MHIYKRFCSQQCKGYIGCSIKEGALFILLVRCYLYIADCWGAHTQYGVSASLSGSEQVVFVFGPRHRRIRLCFLYVTFFFFFKEIIKHYLEIVAIHMTWEIHTKKEWMNESPRQGKNKSKESKKGWLNEWKERERYIIPTCSCGSLAMSLGLSQRVHVPK